MSKSIWKCSSNFWISAASVNPARSKSATRLKSTLWRLVSCTSFWNLFSINLKQSRSRHSLVFTWSLSPSIEAPPSLWEFWFYRALMRFQKMDRRYSCRFARSLVTASSSGCNDQSPNRMLRPRVSSMKLSACFTVHLVKPQLTIWSAFCLKSGRKLIIDSIIW